MTNFSLYIHYPFCIKRCPYCGFATAVEKEDLAVKYREALLIELKQRAIEEPWRNGTVETIYFGGGTPSLMPPEYVGEVIELVRGLWRFAVEGDPPLPPPAIAGRERTGSSEIAGGESAVEITLEANPETRDIKAFRGFREAGVNRISMGAQSFDPEELKVLGRAHSVDGVREAVVMAGDAGFDNLSLDLIYGVPGQTVESFRRSVECAIGLGIEHLSTYTLSIEEGTPFARSVKEKRLPNPDPDLMADQYEVLIELTRASGFEHYELTNYGKPGLFSRHNSAYWQRTPFLGVGCGAHSFDGTLRFWNRRDTRQHIAAVHSGKDPREGEESLTLADVMQEQLYLELRQAHGLLPSEVNRLCNPEVVEELLNSAFLVWQNGRLRVTEEKWLMLDEIVLRLQNRSHHPD